MAARPVGSGRWVRPAGEWQTGNGGQQANIFDRICFLVRLRAN